MFRKVFLNSDGQNSWATFIRRLGDDGDYEYEIAATSGNCDLSIGQVLSREEYDEATNRDPDEVFRLATAF